MYKATKRRIIQRIEQHFHRHMLIPTINRFYNKSTRNLGSLCWRNVSICYQNDLQVVWAYLWENWYNWLQFCLWARCSFSEIIVYKTTMLIESHWRTLKHDHLYKIARPRLGLLCFIITIKVFLNNWSAIIFCVKDVNNPLGEKTLNLLNGDH